jgi:hypothetical protein
MKRKRGWALFGAAIGAIGTGIVAIAVWPFSCKHTNTSRPWSTRNDRQRTKAARRTGAYIVCLDCGKEFSYDLQDMKIVGGKI